MYLGAIRKRVGEGSQQSLDKPSFGWCNEIQHVNRDLGLKCSPNCENDHWVIVTERHNTCARQAIDVHVVIGIEQIHSLGSHEGRVNVARVGARCRLQARHRFPVLLRGRAGQAV